MTKRNKRGSREQGPGRGREVEERDEERAREPEPERRSGRKFARIISWHLVKVDRDFFLLPVSEPIFILNNSRLYQRMVKPPRDRHTRHVPTCLSNNSIIIYIYMRDHIDVCYSHSCLKPTHPIASHVTNT